MAVILRVGRGRMWIVVTRVPWRPRVHHGCCSCLLTVHHVSHAGRVGARVATGACKIGPCISRIINWSSKRERRKKRMDRLIEFLKVTKGSKGGHLCTPIIYLFFVKFDCYNVFQNL